MPRHHPGWKRTWGKWCQDAANNPYGEQSVLKPKPPMRRPIPGSPSCSASGILLRYRRNCQSLASGIRRSVTASQTTIAISGTDKAIVLDPAANAIRAVFAQCFHPYHADSTKNWPNPFSAARMMHRDAKSAFPDLTRHKCSVRQAVEPVTAQVLSHGLHNLGRTRPDEAKRPVDLHPGSSSTLPYSGIRFVNLMRAQVGWESVDGFRQHKKVPDAESIFRAIKKPGKNVANPSYTNYLHEFSMFLAGLQITPKDLKSCRSSMRTGDYARLDTSVISAILTNVSKRKIRILLALNP